MTACVEAARQILAQAADAEVAREHPEAGEHLVEVEQLLALAEAVHHHGDRADLHAVRAEPHEVAADSRCSSAMSTRIQITRSGICDSRPSSRSTDRQNARLFDCGAEVVHPLDERDRSAATSSARPSSRCRCAGSRSSARPRRCSRRRARSTSRSTPCVLGCCGPMLTVIVSVRISGIDLVSPGALSCVRLRARSRCARMFAANSSADSCIGDHDAVSLRICTG